MRITNQWKYAQTMFDYQRGMKGVQKHNMQLSSGLKIQNSYEAAGTYNDAMRLDYEITTLEQVVEATSKSQNFAKNSDKSLQEFSKQLENFKVKLVQAASDIHNTTSLEAIANDLEGIKDHLMNIANTSINGQFLFSGSAVDTKPISHNGTYWGNKEDMKTLSGSKVEIPFNLNGYELFLGKDKDYNKIISTNVKLSDQTKTDADLNPKYLNEDSKIRHMIGLNYVKDKDTIEKDYDFLDSSQVKFPDTYFYIQGTKPDGTSFTSKFSLTNDTTMRGLMDKIGQEFGNIPNGTRVVDVNMNNDGQIVIKDLTKGSQVIDFHMVAATEKVQNKQGLENATNNTNPPSNVNFLVDLRLAANAGSVHITDFNKNKYIDAGSTHNREVDSFIYDKVKLEKKDNTLTGNISQITRKGGEYATDSTRLSEVAGTHELYANYNDRYNIDGHHISLVVDSISGIKYTVNIAFENNNGGHVNFNVVGFKNRTQVYPIPTAGNPNPAPKGFNVWHATEFGQFQTNAADFTFRQLNDIIGMVASDTLPTDVTYEEYNKAIDVSRGAVEVGLNHQGKLQLTDKTKSVTNIDVSINDLASGEFKGDSTGKAANAKQGNGSIFTFMNNNSPTIDEPSIDLFKDLTKMIEAVRSGYFRADANSADPRNTGIQGGIERIDHIMDHINKEKVKIGSYTNLLQDTNNRASLMKVNVASVKSEIIDADYAESYLSLTQKMMSYQAMLQATSKINQLSLLNYLN